jgi:transcriptional regulator with XRE-family HTH domain
MGEVIDPGNGSTPQQAGLVAYGRNRRVPGLRREEVATLAGVSIDYCTQLERGKLTGVSDSVLEALAGALQLDEAAFLHPAATEFYPYWEDAANTTVALLRTEAGRDPFDEAMALSADEGLTLTAYSAEPGSPAHDAVELLASWAATLDQAESAPASDRA